MTYKFITLLPLALFGWSTSSITSAELTAIATAELAQISGQSGIGMDSIVDLKIDNISYQQQPTASYFMLNDVVAQYSYVGASLDVTAEGALRFGLPDFIKFDELSFSVYNSSTAVLDINNPDSIQTYTIYADTLGNAYDGFDLNITGATFDNGRSTYSGNYINSNTLEDNRSTQLTITSATDIKLTLTSDDDCTGFGCDNQEDFAHIVIADEDGNIVTQAGTAGTNNTQLDYRFESPINNNFLVRATLTGTFKMGGAIEMFGTTNVALKR